MIRLHHLNASRSRRTVWLLEELGLEYELVRYDRLADTGLAPPALKEVHALGKAPVLEDGDAVLIESGAIAEYLLARYGKGRLVPAVFSPDYPRYLQWIHAAEGVALLPGLSLFMLGRFGVTEGPMVDYYAGQAMEFYGYLESERAKSPYFAGATFSAADIGMEWVVNSANSRGVLANLPATADWLARVQERDAFKKTIEIGV